MDSPNSALFRFCLCSFFRIPLDSVLVSESKWLDSEFSLDKGAPHGIFSFDFCVAKMTESKALESLDSA
ncbi:hypothetical protein [uncultured Helicobacter sp.]|uniref:hypothetical protein n=1 Tax=uncultured Helicobacter sp. TaxID=175537 RepID=UPI00375282DC